MNCCSCWTTVVVAVFRFSLHGLFFISLRLLYKRVIASAAKQYDLVLVITWRIVSVFRISRLVWSYRFIESCTQTWCLIQSRTHAEQSLGHNGSECHLSHIGGTRETQRYIYIYIKRQRDEQRSVLSLWEFWRTKSWAGLHFRRQWNVARLIDV